MTADPRTGHETGCNAAGDNQLGTNMVTTRVGSLICPRCAELKGWIRRKP